MKFGTGLTYDMYFNPIELRYMQGDNLTLTYMGFVNDLLYSPYSYDISSSILKFGIGLTYAII